MIKKDAHDTHTQTSPKGLSMAPRGTEYSYRTRPSVKTKKHTHTYKKAKQKHDPRQAAASSPNPLEQNTKTQR